MEEHVETLQEGFVILLHASGLGRLEQLRGENPIYLYHRLAQANDQLQIFVRLPPRRLVEILIDQASSGWTGRITTRDLPENHDPQAWQSAQLEPYNAALVRRMYADLMEAALVGV